jgi:hypothetical protein
VCITKYARPKCMAKYIISVKILHIRMHRIDNNISGDHIWSYRYGALVLVLYKFGVPYEICLLRAQVLRPKTSQTLFGPVIFLNKLGSVNSNFHFEDWYLCNWNPPSNSGVKSLTGFGPEDRCSWAAHREEYIIGWHYISPPPKKPTFTCAEIISFLWTFHRVSERYVAIT